MRMAPRATCVTLVFDAAGTLYGTTSAGGASSAGTVFALKRTAGAWSERAVYSFSNDGADGQSPMSGLVLNSAGNLFGTTLKGGTRAAVALCSK